MCINGCSLITNLNRHILILLAKPFPSTWCLKAFDFNPSINNFNHPIIWLVEFVLISYHEIIYNALNKRNTVMKLNTRFFLKSCSLCVFEVLAVYLLIILVGTNFGQNIEQIKENSTWLYTMFHIFFTFLFWSFSADRNSIRASPKSELL